MAQDTADSAKRAVTRSAELGGVVLVHGYDEIREAVSAPDRFTTCGPAVARNGRGAGAPLFEQDDERHRRWRVLLREFFAPAAAAAQERHIRSSCREALQELIPLGEADLVAAYTRRVPLLMVGRLLGLTELECAVLSEYTRALADAGTAAQARRGYAGFLRERVHERRRGYTGDLLTRMVTAEVGGRTATDDELITMTMLIVEAGSLTTADACATAILRLLEQPSLQARLTADPTLLEFFAEEVVRFEPAVTAASRTAVADTCLGGVPVSAGERLLLVWGSANRDERRFADGGVFRLDRPRASAPHLGWGAGRHRCPGRHLARVALRVMLAELLAALPGLRLRPGCPNRRAAGGIVALPVQWTR